MQLSAYLDTEKISDADFADAIGVSRQAVHRYKIGERFPELHVLVEIFRVTRGRVTANDFANLPARRGAA